MSNPIKYSTGSESLALKKGNFYIGTGDVGKGPTSTTGYYNGITPPSGGYAIYLNKETGGPSIYTASNDAQLISLTNSIAGQSYTTVNECLVYFAGQTDKMVLNRNYEGIVTDGLIFNLDAGFTPSYPKSGTLWYDLTTNTNNGTLTNNPTFSSNDGGTMIFDGADDYVVIPQTSTFNLSGLQFSINIWFNSYSWTSVWQAIFTKGDDSWRIHRYSSVSPVRIAFGTSSLSVVDTFTSTIFNTNTWYNVTCIYDGVSKKIYVNGILDNNTAVTGTLSNGSWPPNIGRNAQFPGSSFRYFHGSVPIAQIYNRALSADEVLQNYNAQKGRFGL
jgi:hypothetical protein